MSTFIQKLRTITLGTVHDLLDKTVDLNSPSALRQHVRDLENALDKMRNDAAVQAGTLRTLEREKGDLHSRIENEKSLIQKILAGGSGVKEDLARLKGTAVVQLQQQEASLATQIETQRANSQAIDQAALRLETKHQQVVYRLRELERLDRDTKTREQAATSLRLAEAVLNTGAGGVSIDNIESKMLARNDVAHERFNRAISSFSNGSGSDSDSSSEVDKLLNSLRPNQEVTSSAS